MNPNSPDLHGKNPDPTRAALEAVFATGEGDEPNGYVAPTRTPNLPEYPKDGDRRDLQLPTTIESRIVPKTPLVDNLPGWGRTPKGSPN